MSRHGTDTNPAEVMKKALEKFRTATGFLLPMVVSVPRGEALPRSVRKLLSKRGRVRIQAVSLVLLILCLGVGPCSDAPETKQEEELIKPQPATCAYLKAASDRQVGACLQMCPDRDETCAKESCFNGDIRRWKEARSRCQPEYSTLYYPNPKFPPTSILVE